MPSEQEAIERMPKRMIGGLAVGDGSQQSLIDHLTVTLSPAAVAANATAEQIFALAGLKVNDFVYVIKPTAQAGLGIVGARVSSAGNIGITFSNNTAGALTPTAAEVYRVFVLRKA